MAVSVEPLVVSAAPPPTPWIVSRTYDLSFFSGSVAVPIALWAAFAHGFLTGIGVYAVFQLAFNMPHNVQTWTMSVLDHDDRKTNGRRYLLAFLVLAVFLGGTMLLSPKGVYPWVRDAIVYWGYYHLVRQHYGFQRLYERRMAVLGSKASPLESKLYARYLDLVSYAPLLIRFRDPNLMTIRAAGRSIHIWHPLLPEFAWKAVALVYGASIFAAVVHHVVAAARGRTYLLPRATLLASVTLAFGLAGLVIDDIIVAIAIVTSFHNIQYLGLVLFHNRTRAQISNREALPLGRNLPLDWLRAGRVLPYALMTFVYGLVVFVPRIGLRDVLFAELPITLVVTFHYYVDARIWKFNHYPNLSRYLRLRA